MLSHRRISGWCSLIEERCLETAGWVTVWPPLGGLQEEPAGASAQTAKMITVALYVKRKRGRGWASGPSRLTVGSDGVVRPEMVTLGNAYCTRGQQQQSQPPAFCTRNRNNTQYTTTTALAVKIASMSGSRRWMCQLVIRRFKGKGQGLGVGFGCLIKIRPRWMEKQLTRRREVPRGLKKRGKHRHPGGYA